MAAAKESDGSDGSLAESFMMVSDSLSQLNIYDGDELSDSPDQDPIEFLGVQSSYPIGCDLFCNYRIIDKYFQHRMGDCIALCKYEDKTKTRVLCSVALPDVIKQNKICAVTFFAEYIPKDENMYQFSFYRNNEIAASSPPFSFISSAESDYIEVEDPNDPGLVVFKSKDAQFAEEVAKLTKEKEDFQQKFELGEHTINELKQELKFLKDELRNLVMFNETLIACNDAIRDRTFDAPKPYLPATESNDEAKGDTTLNTPKEESSKTETNGELSLVLSNIEEVKNMLENVQSILVTTEDMNSKKKKLNYEDHSSDKNTGAENSNSPCSKNINRICPEIVVNDTSLKSTSSIELFEDSQEKIALQDKVKKLTEENSFLKSRVEVLEIELRNNSKDQKFQLMVECMANYETECNVLKKQVQQLKATECELSSIKKCCAKLASENSTLQTRLNKFVSGNEMGVDDIIKLKSVKGDLSKALEENKALQNEVCRLRKECIGKVSVCDIQTGDRCQPSSSVKSEVRNTTQGNDLEPTKKGTKQNFQVEQHQIRKPISSTKRYCWRCSRKHASGVTCPANRDKCLSCGVVGHRARRCYYRKNPK